MKYLFTFFVLTSVSVTSAAGLNGIINDPGKKPVVTPQPAPQPPQPPKPPVKK